MRIDPATTGLQPISSELSGEWRFWEMKTPNMHRGVVDYMPLAEVSLIGAERSVRQGVLRVFRPSWWRGFAYGAVIQFSHSPAFPLRDLLACVDSFNRNDGVLQWIVAVDHQAKTAFAAHMWMQGSLHNLFVESLNPLIRLHYSIEKIYKDQPAFFRRIGRLFVSLGKTAARLRAMQAERWPRAVGQKFGFLK